MVAACTSTSTWPGPGVGVGVSTSSRTSAGSPIAVIWSCCMAAFRSGRVSVLFEDVQEDQRTTELDEFPALTQTPERHGREAQCAQEVIEVRTRGGVVTGVEHHLPAVVMSRVGGQIAGEHRVESFDDRGPRQAAGDPFAAGLVAEIDVATVCRCVLGELVGGVDDDPPVPVGHHVGQFGHPHERERQNHQIGFSRSRHGDRVRAVAELGDHVGQTVGAAAVADVHRYPSSDEVACQRLSDGPGSDESNTGEHLFSLLRVGRGNALATTVLNDMWPCARCRYGVTTTVPILPGWDACRAASAMRSREYTPATSKCCVKWVAIVMALATSEMRW